jgi:hypothetical protein
MVNPLEDDPDPTPNELSWWEAGGHPPHKRLWRDGVDVTDEPIEQWDLSIWHRGVRSRAGRSARGHRPSFPA